jgi:hypothetical protein
MHPLFLIQEETMAESKNIKGEEFVKSAKENTKRNLSNAEQYKVKNIAKFEIQEKAIQTTSGTKIKYIANVLYKNGVRKSRVIGVEKNGKMIFGIKSVSKEEYRSIQTGRPIKNKVKKDDK